MNLASLIEKFGHPLRWESDHELVFTCPECRKGLRVNVVKGIFHCFSCSHSGKLDGKWQVNFKQNWNTEVQEHVANFIHQNYELSSDHEEYLLNRGLWYPFEYGFRTISVSLKPDLVKEFGMAKLQAAGILTQAGHISSALSYNRIFFPYWFQDKVVGFKTRQNEYEEDTSPIKYSVLPGSLIHKKPFFRFKTLGKKEDVLVTEGEIKALISNQYQYQCYSLPGISAGKECLSSLSLLLKNHTGRKFLVFDREENSENHYALLQSTLRVSKALGLTIVILPLTGRKTGLDDFLLTQDDLDYYLDLYWDKRKITPKQLEERLMVLKGNGYKEDES